MSKTYEFKLEEHLKMWFAEDVGDGDHSSICCIPEGTTRQAKLLVKADGILAGMELAKQIFHHIDADFIFEPILKDGDQVKVGDIAFVVSGKAHSLLTVERLVLNLMQRMSGIATKTSQFVKAVDGTNVRLLDTRKTTPGLRYIEKWAVRIGGGHNHRMGLYDMIMLKDNHNDFCGGITKAVSQTKNYLKNNNLKLPIEVEVRNETELKEALKCGIERVMLDNFTPAAIVHALKIIEESGVVIETEASGGITLKTIRAYAETGVDFISVGALTHSYKSLDLSLKAY